MAPQSRKLPRAALTHSSGKLGHAVRRVAQLSEQERRVLAEVATGKADKDIALSLGLEAKTVRNYLAQAYRKLSVHSRTQAALLYQQATRTSHPD